MATFPHATNFYLHDGISIPVLVSLNFTHNEKMASDIDEGDDMPTIRFTSIEDLFEIVRQVQGDFLVLTEVSPATFEDLYLQEKRPFRIRRYHASRGILIVTIPTSLHEALHLQIWYIFTLFLFRSGLGTSWTPIGSTTFRPRGHPGGDGGEGDSSGGPSPLCDPADSWPTLVIEAGDSETLSALRDDMRWWFSASEHNVKIVLLTKFDHQNQRIIIERWEEESQNRQGATNTRQVTSGNTLQPVLRQSIRITKDTTTNPASYHVTRDVLVLPFKHLFLRDPGPQEGDCIISVTELATYAENIWGNV
ncbi:hypothetical protein BX600DRAFT_203328 [Xylariales sp. PMI_506]|nr:hypothetical protein BX600DRAFT_203328 [Xylariales sp. PMI_506]